MLRYYYKLVGACSIGTILEWYDFFLFGLLATTIAPKFFPSEDPTSALLYTLASFAIAFVVRPIGGILFGHIGDKYGRKPAILLSISAMGIASIGIGIVPTYESIGIAASVTIVILRIVQGLAIGGEYTGAAIYLAEGTPLASRAYLTSYMQTSPSIGFLFALIITTIIEHSMSGQAYSGWGWRLSFFVSILWLIPSYYIRSKLGESSVFREMQRKKSQQKRPLLALFKKANYRNITLLSIIGLTMGQGVVSYTGFYSMYFLQGYANIPPYIIQSALIWSSAMTMPLYIFFGYLADKVGYKRIIYGGMFLSLLTYFPVFDALHHLASSYDPKSSSIIYELIVIVLCVQKIFFCMVYAPLVALLVNLFPINIRYTGISLAYNIGNGILGGLFPVVAIYLSTKAILPTTWKHLSPLIYPTSLIFISLVIGYNYIKPSVRGKSEDDN